MCKAVQRWENRCRESGLREGLREGLSKGIINCISLCKEFNCSESTTIEQISNKFSLSEQEATDYVTKYW